MLVIYIRKYVLRLLMVCTAMGMFFNSAGAQVFEFTGNRKRETIPFTLVKNLMVIPLTINGAGPYNFVLDTGMGLFLITNPDLIDSVKMQNLRSIKIQGFGAGEELSALVAPSLEITIGSTRAKNVAAAVLKEDLFNLSSFAGMPIHGLIGYDFFNSFIVRISYASNTITIYRPETGYIPRKGNKIPITIENRKPYLVADVDLGNGKKLPAKLIIDTGAGHPLSLETYNGKPFEVPKVNISANLGVGLMGAITGYIARIPSVKLGKYTLHNVIASFPNYAEVGARVQELQRNGNMGNSILKHFEVVFDYGREAIYLKPSPFFKEPFEHDMSGMELSSGGTDFRRVMVTRVEPYSAAEEAGLAKGDEILSINFKPVADMTMQEIDNLFRSRDNRGFILEILHQGSKTKTRVIMTLQRRI